MIHANDRQAKVLARVLSNLHPESAGVELEQQRQSRFNRHGSIKVAHLNRTGKITKYTVIRPDGEHREFA